MTSFLKKSFLALAAGALALALPLMAQAAPLNLGANTNINPGVVYTYEFEGVLASGAHSYLFPFTPFGSQGLAITATIGQTLAGAPLVFTNPVFEILGPGGPFASGNLNAIPGVLSGTIESVPFVLGGAYFLTLGFDLPTAGEGQISVDLSAIPLPAAAWLIIAGLGGLGLVARRRKAA